MKPETVFITGPTASGKTAASVKLAEILGGEIVSADSMQIYRCLDIGSAKPTEDERCGIPHHLMDCIDFTERTFSVSDYRQRASDAIHDIAARGRLPIVCGGTGLYVNSLVYPLNFAHAEPDEELRERLRRIEEREKGALHRMLSEVDAITALRLHPNDVKRIIRALEVYEKTGRPLSSHGNDFRNNAGGDIEFSPIMFGITMPRDMLYARIEQRVDEMMDKGLWQETEDIMKMSGFSEDLPSMQGLGYKQIIAHILHSHPPTREETIAEIKLETRHFAKRQLTWFRRDERIVWLDAAQYESADAMAHHMAEIINERV